MFGKMDKKEKNPQGRGEEMIADGRDGNKWGQRSVNSSHFSGDKCCFDTCIHKPKGHHLTEGTKVSLNLGQVKYISGISKWN